MNLQLTTELQAVLAAEAERVGVSPEQLARDYLKERLTPDQPSPAASLGQAQSLADYLSDHIGVLSSGASIPGGAADVS